MSRGTLTKQNFNPEWPLSLIKPRGTFAKPRPFGESSWPARLKGRDEAKINPERPYVDSVSRGTNSCKEKFNHETPLLQLHTPRNLSCVFCYRAFCSSCYKLFHYRVFCIFYLIRCAYGYNLSVIQHCNSISYLKSADHIMSNNYGCYI